MSIIDTFTILFNQKGAEDVKKGQDAATASAVKTAVALEATGKFGVEAGAAIVRENSKVAESFDVIKEHVGEFAETTLDQLKEIAVGFAALFAAEKLFDNFFETAEQTDQLGERAKSIGVNIETLQAWGNATKRVGGSADAFNGSIENVERSLTRMEATGKSRISPFFKQLGVSMVDAHGKAKKLFDLLPELAKATEGKDKQTSAGALRGIGFDEGTIRLLQAGGKEIDELIERQKKLGLATQKDAEIAEKFNREWDDIQQLFHSITVEFNTAFLPILQSILEAFESVIEFLRDNEDFVKGFFAALTVGILAVIGPITLLGYAMNLLIGGFLILTSPITLTIAALVAFATAIAFVYDDLKNFAEGNKSVTGVILQRWPVVGKMFKWLQESISNFWTFCKMVFNALADTVTHPIAAFKLLQDKVGGVIDYLEKRFGSFKKILDTVKGIGSGIGSGLSVIGSGIKAELTHAGAIMGGRVPGFLSDTSASVPGLPYAKAAVDAARTPLGIASSASLSAAGKGSTTVNTVSVGPTTINATSSDPAAIAKAVDARMTTHVDAAINHLADGVSH